MTTQLPTTKAELRTAMLAARRALPVEQTAAWNAAITHHVTQLPPFMDAGTVAGYLAIGREVETRAILTQALQAGKCVALPRTAAAPNMTLHQVDDLQGLVPGPFGILEPTDAMPTLDPAAVDLFLVPGCAFDARGGRLGYGGGYYDHLLEDRVPGWRVALAYAAQLIPRVPMGPLDMPVDLIVTEHGVLDCARARREGDWMRLRQMQFHGHHGAFLHERQGGIPLTIDAELRLDLQWPGLTDALTTAVNYPAVYALIDHLLRSSSVHLLETLAARIADRLLAEFPVLAEVRLRVAKAHPPVGGPMAAFEVEIARERPTWTRPPRA